MYSIFHFGNIVEKYSFELTLQVLKQFNLKRELHLWLK